METGQPSLKGKSEGLVCRLPLKVTVHSKTNPCGSSALISPTLRPETLPPRGPYPGSRSRSGASLGATDKPVSRAGVQRSGLPQADQRRHFEQGPNLADSVSLSVKSALLTKKVVVGADEILCAQLCNQAGAEQREESGFHLPTTQLRGSKVNRPFDSVSRTRDCEVKPPPPPWPALPFVFCFSYSAFLSQPYQARSELG